MSERKASTPGHYAVNPFSGEEIPIWVGNFVLMGYGTGAIMAVPAHDERDFEFCRKYGIAVRPVIRPVDGALAVEPGMEAAYRDYGVVENSGAWSGLASGEARKKMAAHAEANGFGKAADHVPAEGLGHLAPALLGHADSGGALPDVRRGAAGRRSAAGDAAARRPVHRAGPVAASATRRVPAHDLPEVRRAGRARDRHDGHLRRFVVVLLPLHRSAQ